MATSTKVDTPRKGAWCDTVNTQPLPLTMAHKLTLEGLVAAQRNGMPLNTSVIYDIIQQQDDERREQERETIWRRMNNR